MAFTTSSSDPLSSLQMGLSLDKTTIDQLNPYLDSHQNKCILEESPKSQISGPILFFVLDLKELKYVASLVFLCRFILFGTTFPAEFVLSAPPNGTICTSTTKSRPEPSGTHTWPRSAIRFCFARPALPKISPPRGQMSPWRIPWSKNRRI